jgi:LytS/YehU family sensor histidine kinase
VYRYLLQSNEQSLISLQREMAFIDAYFNLLQTRFTQGLQLKAGIAPSCLDMLLPPLTLQLLVENAVKHNAVLPNSPLVIELFTDSAHYLHVRNNLQSKLRPAPSNKTGLNNIVAKYKLLLPSPVYITHTDTHFEVAVPLLNKAAYAGIDR